MSVHCSIQRTNMAACPKPIAEKTGWFQNDMSSEFSRYATFDGYNTPPGVWPLQLAQAGFYRYPAYGQHQLRCFTCGLVMDVRSACLEPAMVAHCRLSPCCEFVRGSSTNQPVPPVDAACAKDWAKCSFSSLKQGHEPMDFTTTSPQNSVTNISATTASLPASFTEYFDSSNMSAGQSILSDLNTLEQLFSSPHRADNHGGAELHSLPRVASHGQLGGSSSVGQASQQQTSVLGGPADVLVTDSEPTGVHGEYPPSLMEQREGDSWRRTQTAGQQAQTAQSGEGEVTEAASMTEDTLKNLGILTERPKYQNHSTVTQRVASFRGWTGSQSVQSMAEAGFFYTGTGRSDCCRCFFCGGGLKSWETDDNPWVEHARWFTACPFVLTNKGQEFVNAVRVLATKQKKVSLSDVQEEMRRVSESLESHYPNPEEDDSNMNEDAVNGLDDLTMPGICQKTEDLQMENDRLRQTTRCKVCLDADVSVLLLPCGHLVTCGVCAPALNTCPICRQTIRGRSYVQL